MNLWADFLTNDDRPVIHKWKHYFPIYERHFSPMRNQSITVIEIGCGDGGSLQMWKRYFGPHSQIIGLDINPSCKKFEEDQITVRIGSQDDPAFLDSVLNEFGSPDVVIDDGSHVMAHVTATFKHLYPEVSKNGVYLVEDLHTAYWSEFGGGLYEKTSFIEFAKSLVDELNADHSRGSLPTTTFTATTRSMTFYDSVIVFERGLNTKKWAPRMGKERKRR